MSPPKATTHSIETLTRLRKFLGAQSDAALEKAERAKVKDLCHDVSRLDTASWLLVSPDFGHVFSGFERVFSVYVRPMRRRRGLPTLNDAARDRAKPDAFASDYATFDRLSIVYGRLFRGSVIVNYLLGVVVVGLTVASILPQPKFFASLGLREFPEFASYAAGIELACILFIAVVFYYGQTPHAKVESKELGFRGGRWMRRIGRRWHERWLEYRLLAERFRYIELMLSISPGAATQPPFKPAERESMRWYDCYFVWRTEHAELPDLSVHEYRERALALMLEQIRHHDANSARRGAIARRLHRVAVGLFFFSLLLCVVDLFAELIWPGFFNANLKSLVLFGAVLAPVVAAAIHGVLTTTEYNKIADSSKEIADRIASLITTIRGFPTTEGRAAPEALKPIRDAVTAFADAAINEASNWRAMLRDKNIPLG